MNNEGGLSLPQGAGHFSDVFQLFVLAAHANHISDHVINSRRRLIGSSFCPTFLTFKDSTKHILQMKNTETTRKIYAGTHYLSLN